MAFYLGLACRPADLFIAWFFRRRFPRDSNPGWRDWRRSFLVFWVWCGFCLVSWATLKSVCFAFYATGLDAMQRLEQKNEWATTKLKMKKFEDKGWSYQDLLLQVINHDAEAAHYAKWVLAHYTSKITSTPKTGS